VQLLNWPPNSRLPRSAAGRVALESDGITPIYGRDEVAIEVRRLARGTRLNL